ncbi:MAG TPA: anaerobic ribonucleoside-triphosphate reductase activating protein [Desulfobacteraceae bacterium]|nr:anaerobic ribonucleoside-triphosphate reductase activating protein [Deltaproteobacteria bacterium]HDM09959.1 anaerobic ribonucleoside-triphosphate reductase activating protein [Desulfobacteraceae bacterium]
MGSSIRERDLHIGGLQKSSLIDFPGKVGCVIFLKGCNFRCPYCHNPELVEGNGRDCSEISEEFLWEFLEQRRGLLDGVVISGGEPTLQPWIFDLCEGLKDLGYAVKLDTNGSRPEIVEDLLKGGLVDYIAMDIKSDPAGYRSVTREEGASDKILKSIKLIMDNAPAYEFRTTCVRPLVDNSRMRTIARMVEKANLYVLQAAHQTKVLCPEFFNGLSQASAGLGGGNKRGTPILSKNELEALKSIVEPFVNRCIIRS